MGSAFRRIDFPDLLRPNSVILVVPPFAGVDRPSLGLHVLQACAARAGHDVQILYSNFLLAAEIGEELYHSICYAPTESLLGERIFALAAYNRRCSANPVNCPEFRRPSIRDPLLDHGVELERVQDHVVGWVYRLSDWFGSADIRIVGANTTFEQTAAALSILGAVKRRCAKILTLLGGANCEGDMANGIAGIASHVDHIFSGESEQSFVDFLNKVQAGETVEPRIIQGTPLDDMESLATVDYADYYDQLTFAVGQGWIKRNAEIWLTYEASRGCWWGQKSHCTFCGINGQGMGFRQKSAAKVCTELEGLLKAHPNRRVLMTDNIMPINYFSELLPRLRKFDPPLHVFYEQKANMTLEKVESLKSSGVAVIQPGIEALSTALLKRMRKGVSAAQNVALLRFARSVGLAVNWNLLYGFPGDQESDYEETERLIPYLVHLHPPTGVSHLSIDRFSPYFDRSSEYGIESVRPMEAYSSFLPPDAEAMRIAYHFIGDYDCADRRSPELMERIKTQIEQWRGLWTTDAAPPTLSVEQLQDDLFLIVDSRLPHPSRPRIGLIDRERASITLIPGMHRFVSDDILEWAEETGAAVRHEGVVIPLATADPGLIHRLSAECADLRSVPKTEPMATA